MDFALDDDQQLITETVRRFSDRDLRAWAADADRAGAAPARFAHAAGELGFFLDAVPADAGGLLEGDYSHTTRALRGYELGRGCAAPAALCECNVEPALATSRWGSAAAKQALFTALAAGGLATFFNDARGSLTTTAEGTKSDDVRLSGKLLAPALAVAKFALVATHELVALVALEGAKPFTPSGWRAAKWGTIELAAQHVSADFILARGPAAAEVAATILSWARVSLAARAVGVSVGAMEYAEKYAADRVQFGQPIGSFESLIRLRDDALTTAAAARMLVLYAAWQLDEHLPAAHDTASRARVIAGDCVAKATVDAVQIYGGYGFVNDYPVEKLMRDSRAFEALLGDERFGRVLAQKVA